MGYYVETVGDVADQVFFIPREKFDEAYKALCELNNHNELKSGGSFPRTENVKGKHKSYNFSWMDWNYDETCKDLVEVLEEVGFDVYQNDTGIIGLEFDSKRGDEKEFLKALAPFMKDGSYLPFKGEKGECWDYSFHKGKMREVHY